jgi:hypothetical protein
MSNASLHPDSNRHDESNATDDTARATIRRLSAPVVTTGRTIGFWTAVGLPFLYVPLLSAGIDTPDDLLVFGALLVLNVLGLVAGRSHRRE